MAACTGSNSSVSSGSSSGAGSGKPVKGGTLIEAVSDDPANLNPMLTTDLTAEAAIRLWSQGLISLDAAGKPQPELATSWTESKDGLTWTFKLRKGVKWSDGVAFTSADVAYTFNDLSKFHPGTQSLVADVQTVAAPDPLTVVFHLKQTMAPFLTFVDQGDMPIMPEHIYDGTNITTNPANLKPVGLGPFTFDSWVRGQSIKFVRNPDYWDAPKPYLDSVILQEIPDPNSQLSSLLGGQVDYVSSTVLEPSNYQQIKNSGTINVSKYAGAMSQDLLFLNTKAAPLDNVKVRQAIYTALNLPQINTAAYGKYPYVYVPTTMMPPEFPDLITKSVNQTKLYAYNAGKAAKMLDAAGFPEKNGTRFTLSYVYETALPGAEQMGDVIKANLGAIGITVTLVGQDATLQGQTVFIKHDYDLGEQGYTTRGDPALGVDRAYLCNTSTTQLYTNPTGYCNATVDAAAASADTAPTEKDRAADYAQVEKVLASDVPIIPLNSHTRYVALSKKFVNAAPDLDYSGSGDPSWQNVWIAQ